MPIVPVAPYVPLESILNIARVKINDAGGGQGLAGSTLNDAQPYTFTMAQERYLYLQDRLISGGVETFTKYGYIRCIPPTAARNPRVIVSIDFHGYFNGMDINGRVVLPPSCLKPLEIWECQTGGQHWIPMKQLPSSLSSSTQTARFRCWDYKQDTLYMPGATQTNDLKFKMLTYAPALTGASSPVLILNCQTALGLLIAEEACRTFGGPQMAQVLHPLTEEAIHLIINRSGIKESYSSFQRRPFRNRRGRNW
jgi:hypothetical protein